jgi:hypothetical protein
MNKFHYFPVYNKYFIYSNNESGLGDRILGILSTFLYAAVHRFHFRIKDFEPIPLQEIFYSPYPWSDNLWMRQNLNRGVFNFHAAAKHQEELLTEGVIYDRYPNSDAIMVYCNQNFIPYIFSNEVFQERLEEMELTLENSFEELFNHLFVLREEYQKNYDYLKDNILNKEGRTIGVHIRTNHFWGDVPYMTEDTFENYVRAIESMIEEDDKIFLTTDDKKYIDLLKERFPNNKVHSLKGRVVHNSKTENQTVDDFLKTFYEIKLLSECDVRVLSYWSNFSRVAGLLAQDNNFIVDFEVDCDDNWRTKYWCETKNIPTNSTVHESYNITKPINGFRECSLDELMMK